MKGKDFFFCKKRSKKTFALVSRALETGEQKFFAELFFKKATAFLESF